MFLFWDCVSNSFKVVNPTSRKPQAGDRVLGCIMLGSGIVDGLDGGCAHFARLGWVGPWTAVGLDLVVPTRPEIVDLGIQNIAIF